MEFQKGRRVKFGDFGQRPISGFTYHEWVTTTPALEERLFDLETLAAVSGDTAVAPAGFIFHISRCGSTLVSNALRRIRGSVVVNEPVMVTQCLWRAAEKPESVLMQLALVRGLMAAWGARRTGEEERLFVKLTPFDSLFIPLLIRAFPRVPWIFMFREPVEVMVSTHLKPLAISLPSEREAFAAGLSTSEFSEASKVELFARNVGNMCATAADSAGPQAALLDYADMSVDTLGPILSFFGVSPSPEDLRAARGTFNVYSKDKEGKTAWVADTKGKQRGATEAMREAAGRFSRAAYERVRTLSRTPEFSLMSSKIRSSEVPRQDRSPK